MAQLENHRNVYRLKQFAKYPFLTPFRPARILKCAFVYADVAELVDARVSEARDGDIVEVRFLSSAPDQKEGEGNGFVH